MVGRTGEADQNGTDRTDPQHPRAAGRQKQRSIRSPADACVRQRWLYMSWTSLDGVLAVVVLPS